MEVQFINISGKQALKIGFKSFLSHKHVLQILLRFNILVLRLILIKCDGYKNSNLKTIRIEIQSTIKQQTPTSIYIKGPKLIAAKYNFQL